MLRREASIFIIVGATTVLVDYLAYLSLLGLSAPVSVAKAASFVAGTVFAYFANRFWTFSHKSPDRHAWLRFSAVYITSLFSNVTANSAFLAFFESVTLPVSHNNLLTIAFIMATGISAMLNFLGMKFYAFRDSGRMVP